MLEVDSTGLIGDRVFYGGQVGHPAHDHGYVGCIRHCASRGLRGSDREPGFPRNALTLLSSSLAIGSGPSPSITNSE